MVRNGLRGVGDAALGEWVEQGAHVLHIRRRLTAAEAARLPTGPVPRDIRGTGEERRRLDALREALPARLAAIVRRRMAENGGTSL